MDIHFDCPRCGQSLSVEERGAGMRVNCPKCNEQIEIPRGGASSPRPPLNSASNALICPNCKLVNPPEAMLCDCGYDFTAGRMPVVAKPARSTAATAVSKTEPLAIWSLVLSIVSLFSCGLILGLPGVICGHLALSKIHKNSRSEGRGMALAGLTIGYVSMALWLIFITVMLGLRGNPTAVANSMRVQADSQAIRTQLQLYESMNGFFPTTEQGLQALVTQPRSNPYPTRWSQLFKELPKDPLRALSLFRVPNRKDNERHAQSQRTKGNQ
jgi:phage FluMu protein Com